MKLPLLSNPILLAPIFLCLPAAGMQAFRVEQSIDCEPIDVASTPDGALAVVRSVDTGTSTQMVTVWDLLTGASYPVTPCASGTLGRGSPTQWRSDAVAVTNSRAVLVGSFDDPQYFTPAAEDTTHVDILSLDYTSEPVVTCLNSFDLNGGAAVPTWNTISGDAHDVAITPDGRLAVVHTRNWIYVFNLRNATLVDQINIGLDNEPTPMMTSPKAWFGGESFVSAVDSVECTNTRAVVITNVYPYVSGAWRPRTWVYIVDLVPSDPPFVQKHKVLYNVGSLYSFTAHDLAITPDGSKAVVTASGAVAFFDLATGLPIGTDVNQSAYWRHYPLIADSVECTNTRAVTISNTFDGPGIKSKYRIDVFDLTAPQPDPPLRTYAFSGSEEDRAHDLAITPDGLQAIVKSELTSILIPSLAAPPASPVTFGSVAMPLGAFTLVSDSIVATNSFAIGIGTPFRPQGGNQEAVVHFMSLVDPYLHTTYSSSTSHSSIPGDIALNADQTKVIVRSVSWPENPSAFDILIFPVNLTATPAARYAANGGLTGVDSLAVGVNGAVSISTINLGGPGRVQFFAP